MLVFLGSNHWSAEPLLMDPMGTCFGLKRSLARISIMTKPYQILILDDTSKADKNTW